MAGPIAGFRIVDLTVGYSGPYACMILGDQGAEVIKVEPVGTGELTRLDPGQRGTLNPSFVNVNRSKRAIQLDLKSPRGVELLLELVKNADVFVQNFRPGAAERMGIGEEALRAICPGLIYVSISGYGEEGPFSKQRVWDPVIQAMSGMMSAQGVGGRPTSIRTFLPDKLTAVTAAQAITAALLARAQTGEGQHVRLSMLDTCIAWMWPDAMTPYTWADEELEQLPSPDFCFETADGYLTCLVVSDGNWAGLCRAAEKPEWQSDPRFEKQDARFSNFSLLFETMTELFLTRPAEEWLERLAKEDVPSAPVLNPKQLLEHPQIVASGIAIESEHPSAGRIREARPAARFDRTPAEPERHAPSLGEHTNEVLGELGLSSNEISALRSEGVIG